VENALKKNRVQLRSSKRLGKSAYCNGTHSPNPVSQAKKHPARKGRPAPENGRNAHLKDGKRQRAQNEEIGRSQNRPRNRRLFKHHSAALETKTADIVPVAIGRKREGEGS